MILEVLLLQPNCHSKVIVTARTIIFCRHRHSWEKSWSFDDWHDNISM